MIENVSHVAPRIEQQRRLRIARLRVRFQPWDRGINARFRASHKFVPTGLPLSPFAPLLPLAVDDDEIRVDVAFLRKKVEIYSGSL